MIFGTDCEKIKQRKKRKIMKTTKLIVSIALVALATASFGQRTFSLERLLPAQNLDVPGILAENQTEANRIEIWMHDLHGRASSKMLWNVYEAPVVSRTIFVEEAEVVYDESLELETWMIVPFEKDLNEVELTLEPWMTSPFETNPLEDDLVLESWMTTSFEAAEDIELEGWMTAIWH